MTLTGAELKLIERYMDASEKIYSVLRPGVDSMLDALNNQDIELLRVAFDNVSAKMQEFSDVVNYKTYHSVATLIERELALEPGYGIMTVPVSIAAVTDWHDRAANIEYHLTENFSSEVFDGIEEELIMVEKDLKQLPQVTKWLEEFLLKASEKTDKSYRSSKSARRSSSYQKKTGFADISLIEDWRDTAQELLPQLEKMRKEIETAVKSRDFSILESTVLALGDFTRKYYSRVGYHSYMKLLEEIEGIMGLPLAGSMNLPVSLSSSSNWTTQSDVLWGIVNEANRSDEIDEEQVFGDANVVLKKFEKDIRNIPKMIKWLNDFLDKYGE